MGYMPTDWTRTKTVRGPRVTRGTRVTFLISA